MRSTSRSVAPAPARIVSPLPRETSTPTEAAVPKNPSTSSTRPLSIHSQALPTAS